MRFTAEILDEIRSLVPVSRVAGRRVSLVRVGREWKGLSPFQHERTPSFCVNDRKRFYHCFSSGRHGDVFTFLMETEGLTFPEAVEALAAEAASICLRDRPRAMSPAAGDANCSMPSRPPAPSSAPASPTRRGTTPVRFWTGAASTMRRARGSESVTRPPA
ncbi:CHC2 zinc finger domain-containing protein [Methylobacterium radiotolerans]